MTSTVGLRAFRLGAVISSLFITAVASAQSTRVTDVPATRFFSVWANGDTIAAGADTAVYLSTNGGVSWHRSTKPAAAVTRVKAVRMRNGRLYAGTSGQGVFVSDDQGTTWQAFNQGLVGGILNSQLDLSDFEVRGDSLFAGTFGAGVYVRNLVGVSTWHPLGTELELNQASNVNDVTLGGTRLLASGGSNGAVFHNDPGETDWTISNLDNLGIHAGVQAMSAAWTTTGWAVGTTSGVFHSAAGQEPWTRTILSIGPLSWATLVTQGRHLFAAFDTPNFAVIDHSADDGATWQELENLPQVFIEQVAISGSDLYAARVDGLWRRSIAATSVPIGGDPKSLRFALAGPQPFGNEARLRFNLPEAGTATLEVFDVLGRRAAERIEATWSAGPHEVSVDARRLAPGVYAARLTAAGTSEVVRLVHL